MALSAQKSVLTSRPTVSSRRILVVRPVRAAVDYQAPSTRTGANELEALASMSNVVSERVLLLPELLHVCFGSFRLCVCENMGYSGLYGMLPAVSQQCLRSIEVDDLDHLPKRCLTCQISLRCSALVLYYCGLMLETACRPPVLLPGPSAAGAGYTAAADRPFCAAESSNRVVAAAQLAS